MDPSILLFSTFILLMQTGFAALEAGMIESAFATNILLKNAVDSAVAALVFWVCGYAFAYGEGNSFIGWTNFALSAVEDGTGSSSADFETEGCASTEYALWFFQYAFAATAATIVSGAVAQRISFVGYLTVTAVMTGFIYPLVVRWLWYVDGWLSIHAHEYALAGGAIDFAGSGVVHVTGGVVGLVGSIIIGYRNRFSTDHRVRPPRFELLDGVWKTNPLPRASEHLATIGTFFLFIGWIAFNVGSYSAPGGDGDAYALGDMGRIAINTVLSSAACALTTLVIAAFLRRQAWSRGASSKGTNIEDALNGILAGLVGVTGACGVVRTEIAVVIGILSAPIFKAASELLVRYRIDDPLDAFPVHGACGAAGMIMTGLFAHPVYVERLYGAVEGGKPHGGLFYTGRGDLLAAQLAATLTIAVWAALLSGVLFQAMRAWDTRVGPLFFLRSGDSMELVGFGEHVSTSGSGTSDRISLDFLSHRNTPAPTRNGMTTSGGMRSNEGTSSDAEPRIIGSVRRMSPPPGGSSNNVGDPTGSGSGSMSGSSRLTSSNRMLGRGGVAAPAKRNSGRATPT
jgi:Amt family ammonium transporter